MPSSRDKFAGLAATVGVVTVLIVGFVNLGGPRTQRLIQADNQRIRNLSTLAVEIKTNWAGSNHLLPSALDEVASSNQIRYDPVSGAPYEYHPSDTSQYQLCANFAREFRPAGRSTFWAHPAGRYCFQLDASRFSEPFYPY
jgi:hypothetical protein